MERVLQINLSPDGGGSQKMKRQKRIKTILGRLGIVGYLFLQSIAAKELGGLNLGTFGALFPVEENNLIEVIQARLAKLQQEGTLEKHQQKIQAKIKKQVERPTPVEGIIHTVEPRTFTFDPSITVTSDLKDHQGTVFHHKGERVNPLKLRELTKPLLFIDADVPEHITWAFFMLKRHPLAKVILVKGAPLQMMKDLGIQVFFDQFGKITHKLGIKQVPAIVRQDGLLLKIEEVKADAATLVATRHKEAQRLKTSKTSKQRA
jgi:conjugal transfer pilus assembly protein TraW